MKIDDEDDDVLCCLSLHCLQAPHFGIGFTTTSPDSRGMLWKRNDFIGSRQRHCWLSVDWNGCRAYHMEQYRALPWEPSCTVGKTMGCSVSEEGEFRLCYNSMDADDVVLTGLPTDQPLWGFIVLRGKWKVEADFDVATPNGEPVGGLTCLLSLVVGLAFTFTVYYSLGVGGKVELIF